MPRMVFKTSAGNTTPTGSDSPTPTGTSGGSRRVKTGDASINGRIAFAVVLIVSGLAIVLFRKRILSEVENDEE